MGAAGIFPNVEMSIELEQAEIELNRYGEFGRVASIVKIKIMLQAQTCKLFKPWL